MSSLFSSLIRKFYQFGQVQEDKYEVRTSWISPHRYVLFNEGVKLCYYFDSHSATVIVLLSKNLSNPSNRQTT